MADTKRRGPEPRPPGPPGPWPAHPKDGFTQVFPQYMRPGDRCHWGEVRGWPLYTPGEPTCWVRFDTGSLDMDTTTRITIHRSEHREATSRQ